jgi:hypothetical protein
MRLSSWGWASVVWLASLPLALGQSAGFYPLELVKPGQTGVCKTVFEGTKVETVEVEILGVVRNTGPKQDMILARFPGERLARSGVFAGMSGSPVYVDGKLVGAVAYSFPFAKEPVAGVTPIQQMVDIFKERPPTPKQAALPSPKRLAYASASRLPGSAPAGTPPLWSLSPSYSWPQVGEFRPIATPVNFSGFAPQVVYEAASQLRLLGLAPVRGMGGRAAAPVDAAPLEPGSSVSVELVRGDMDVSATGTVTHISGDRIYAFGHPFLNIGYTDLPINRASVVTVVPSLMNSEKIAVTLDPVGAVKQDRATGIMAMAGGKPRMIPVHLKLATSRNEAKDFKFEVVVDTFLTPFLMALSVQNSIVSSERAIGGQTLQIKCNIAVKGQPEVVFQNSVTELASGPTYAALAASAPVQFLLNSGFTDLVMEKIGIEIACVEETRQATLEKVWQDKLEARPGEEVILTVFLRKPNGEILSESYPVKVPQDMPPGPLRLMVADGLSLEKADADTELDEYVPASLQQLIKAINNIKKNDRLYIRLFRDQAGAVIGGEALPDLPPSLLVLYGSQKTSGDVKPIKKVIYIEHELPPTDYVLTGQRVVKVNIKS